MKALEEVVKEVLSPVISYLNGCREVFNKKSTLSQKIADGTFTYKNLAQVTLGSIIIMTIIELIDKQINPDIISIYTLIPIPVINEISLTILIYFFAFINTSFSKFSLLFHEKKIPFNTLFIGCTMVMVITMPLCSILDLILAFILPPDYLKHTAMGYTSGQMHMMGDVISKLYQINRSTVVISLFLFTFIFILLTFIIVGLFFN